MSKTFASQKEEEVDAVVRPSFEWQLPERLENLAGMQKLRIVFGGGFKFESKPRNLQAFTKTLDEGIAICASKYIAGMEHLKAILYQSAEYWVRKRKLAKNSSIELLMRITCQAQISKAIELSEVSQSNNVALFGFTKSKEQIKVVFERLASIGALRDDLVLDMDSEKESFLRKFHRLPDWCSSLDIPSLLSEKSALLVFSK